MDERREQLRDFLTSRRARLTPQQVGLPRYGGSARRVPGLRRSELATLAGMSVERPTELERGNATGASDGVLTALARCSSTGPRPPTCSTWPVAPAMPPAPPAAPARGRVRPGVQQLLDAMTGVPAFVQDGRLDVLAANAFARALYADLFEQTGPSDGRGPARLPNHAR